MHLGKLAKPTKNWEREEERERKGKENECIEFETEEKKL